MLFISLDSLTYVIFRSLIKLIEDQGFPGGSVVKNLPANTGVTGYMRSIPLLGRSPEKGNGSLFQFSCLGNHMDRGARWATVHGCKELDMTEHAPIA